MKISTQVWTRRRVLRGLLAGSAVTVGLPIFDCMLNDSGTAFADTGAPLPTRFASWFWGLGIGENDWVPKQTGTDYELPVELSALTPFKKKLNLFTGGEVFLDGQANQTHFTGVQGFMTGTVTSSGDYFNSVDTIVGDAIGGRTRFRSLQVSCDGDPKASWSARAGGKQPAEVSPLALYTTLFGPGFTDPNAAKFVPDPMVMVRRSVLSGINDERAALIKRLGAGDRAKLDYYFTSLRALEQQLDVQLQKPQPLPSCHKPESGIKDEGQPLSLATEAMARHDVFCRLLTAALACDQTRLVNLSITQGMSGLRKQGDPTNHHTYTHEEPIDPKLGYQVKCAWFQRRYMEGLRDFAAMLDAVHEGDRTLLDHMMLFAYTDHSAPRLHSLRNYVFMTIGDAHRRIKTGRHVRRAGDAATRVTLTIQQAMGVAVSSWGTKSNRVTAPIPEVLA